MAIGIISAMQEETQTLLDNLHEPVATIKGMRTYYHGKLFNVEIVLVFSRWGKVASATTVTQLINDFEVDEIIFTGVAGAIPLQIKENGFNAYKYTNKEALARWIEEAAKLASR